MDFPSVPKDTPSYDTTPVKTYVPPPSNVSTKNANNYYSASDPHYTADDIQQPQQQPQPVKDLMDFSTPCKSSLLSIDI